MSTTILEPLLMKYDWTAVEIAGRIGPDATMTLRPYLSHEDELIRLLAVDSIIAAGGPETPSLLIKALDDANEQVRINAVNGLHKHLPNKQEAGLLKVWDKTHDTYVKQQIPMVIGRLANRNMIPQLSSRLKNQQANDDQEVRDGLIAGLSKLGDPPAQSQFGKLLAEARGERIKELIDLVQYLDEPWIIPHLRPVLIRKEMAVNLSSHRTTVIRRGCDLAVDEVIRLSGEKFSFESSPIAQYSEAQIAEIARYVDQYQP